jgi:hypothetical protein
VEKITENRTAIFSKTEKRRWKSLPGVRAAPSPLRNWPKIFQKND